MDRSNRKISRRDWLRGGVVLVAGMTAVTGITSVMGCGGGVAPDGNLPADMTRRIDSAIETAMAAKKLPGVVVGVWIPGRGQYISVRGKANLKTGEARDTVSPFRIASISKTFIATAILQLEDAGKLSVSDKLAKWYPAFPNADKITVDNLLRMRSGVPDSANTAFLEEYFFNPTINLTAEDMIARSAARKSEFTTPDQKTNYANVNFIILERIVEQVSGQPINVYLRKNIFDRLGMSGSLYPTDNNLPGKLHGYSAILNGEFKDMTVINPAPAGGAGAVISTLNDLKVYVKAIATGTLLKSGTQKTRLETIAFEGGPDIVRYGQGIGKVGKFYGHNGTIFGFSTEMWYLPEKDAVIVINVNRLDKDDESKSSPLFFEIAKIVLPEDVSW